MQTDSRRPPSAGTAWERDLIEQLATDSLREKRRARRWGIFFKFLFFAYLIALLALWSPELWQEGSIGVEDHTALVDLTGLIADGEGTSADEVVEGLRDAFEHKHTKGVILRINSPGGTPVQAAYIHDEILRLREEYPDIPLYAVVSDICASGGYYVAAAAQEIYVNESSIVGSIGVLMNGFGFVDTLDKLGIERRLLTAGENKAIMDPFSPLDTADQAYLEGLLAKLHDNFIAAVRNGRGERLSDNPELFTGLFWTGTEAIELGLADALGSAGLVAREVIGEEKIVDFTAEEDVFSRLSSRLSTGLGAAISEGLFTRLSSPSAVIPTF